MTKLVASCFVYPGRNRVPASENAQIDPHHRVVRASDIGLTLSPWEELPPSDSEKKMSVRVKPGDIIGSISGPHGRWAIVPEDYGLAFASDHTVVLRARTKDTSMWYILGFLRSPEGKRQLETTVNGTVIRRIAIAPLRQVELPPIPNEPGYADKVLSDFDQEVQKLAREVTSLRAKQDDLFEQDTTDRNAALDSLRGLVSSVRVLADLSDLSAIARNSFPYPIARTIRAVEGALTARERYQEIVHQYLESSTALLAALAASLLRQLDLPRGRAAKSWLTATKGKGSTLGTRWNMICEIATVLDGSSLHPDIGGLGAALGETGENDSDPMKELLVERNRIHGEHPLSEFEFASRMPEIEVRLEQSLRFLSFLARWEILFIDSVEPVAAGRGKPFRFGATTRLLRGDNPDWVIRKYEFDRPVFRGRTYALVDETVLVDLEPYLIVRNCSQCYSLEVYSPDSFSNDEARLLAIDRGHSNQVRERNLLDSLRAAY